MGRFIDAEILPKDEFFEGLSDIEKAKVLQWMISAPTADVVEVVRCADCKHCNKYKNWNNREYLGCNCNCDVTEVKADHYCSYGERRTENEI